MKQEIFRNRKHEWTVTKGMTVFSAFSTALKKVRRCVAMKSLAIKQTYLSLLSWHFNRNGHMTWDKLFGSVAKKVIASKNRSGLNSSLYLLKWNKRGCIAQRRHSCFLPSSPRFESRLCQVCFSLLLSWYHEDNYETIERRSNKNPAPGWIRTHNLMIPRRVLYRCVTTAVSL